MCRGYSLKSLVEILDYNLDSREFTTNNLKSYKGLFEGKIIGQINEYHGTTIIIPPKADQQIISEKIPSPLSRVISNHELTKWTI